MSDSQELTIDTNEIFPQLEKSPLIEAVIYWQAQANQPLNPKSLKEELTRKLPDYPVIQTQQDFRVEASVKADGTSEGTHEVRWNGFRLQNESKKYVAQFTPTGIAISRIEGYQSWETFHQEALRLWEVFQEIAEPTTINRFGARYINKILLRNGESVSTYLKTLPHNNLNKFMKKSFFYQDTYEVPNYPYSINWVCTQSNQAEKTFIIIDIDVFVSKVVELKKLVLTDHLSKIRWLKNKIFFDNITNKALDIFGG